MLIVGAGRSNMSGISRYTEELAGAADLAGHQVVVLAARKMLPDLLHPARGRKAAVENSEPSAAAAAAPRIAPVETLHYLPGLGTVRGWKAAWRHRPEVTVLQWWTGTMLHHHIAISIITRLRGGTVILEAHETIDPSEAAVPGVRTYVRFGMRILRRLIQGVVVHSEADRRSLPGELGLDGITTAVAHHGPYLQTGGRDGRNQDDRRTHVLHLGVIRPYKGLPTLVEAVRRLNEAGHDIHLTIAGEVWDERETATAAQLGSNVTTILHHLTEQEVADLVASCDIVALPYHTSRASGPMAIAMAAGKPFAASRLETLVETAAGYTGAAWAEPGDPETLAEAIIEARRLQSGQHRHPHSWASTVTTILDLAGTPAAGMTEKSHPTAAGRRTA